MSQEDTTEYDMRSPVKTAVVVAEEPPVIVPEQVRFTGTKLQYRVLRWLMKAVAHDQTRPVLNAVLLGKDKAVGVDGNRLHAAAPTAVPAVEGQTDDLLAQSVSETGRLNYTPAEGLGALPRGEGTFPKVDQIVPSTDVDAAEIHMNANYLIDALEGMKKGPGGGMVRLISRGPTRPFEVLGYADEEGQHPLYALIMPMYVCLSSSLPFNWRPGSEEPLPRGKK